MSHSSSTHPSRHNPLTRRVRRWHRFLGLFIGIQFLGWVLGGLYFSWMDLDTVHGDDRRAEGPTFPEDFDAAELDPLLAQLAAQKPGFQLRRAELRPLPDSALYVISYRSDDGSGTQLADAAIGELRRPLSEFESRALAQSYYSGEGSIRQHRLLQETGTHHEYRELPLPAHVFEFDDARRTRIYVAPELGRVSSFRNHQWRVFDFLWMLHTMDYGGRDNFNNWLLRGFSLMGLATVLSGFWLFFLTRRPRVRKN